MDLFEVVPYYETMSVFQRFVRQPVLAYLTLLAFTVWTSLAAESRPNEPSTVLLQLTGSVGLTGDGTSFSAEEFKECVAQAKKGGLKTLVLQIDSPGGRVDTKEEVIRCLLQLNSEGVRTVAIIKDAGSAAALIALACKDWYALPGCRLGAATTVLTGAGSTMSFDKALESDPALAAKYKSFSSAIDEEACRATGRPPELAIAMKEKSATLWFTPGRGLTSDRIGEASRSVDTKDTILTLTATQLVDFQMAQSVTSAEQALERIGGCDASRSKRLQRELGSSQQDLSKLLDQASKLEQEIRDIPSSGLRFGRGSGNSRDAGKQAASSRDAQRKAKLEKHSKLVDRIINLYSTP